MPRRLRNIESMPWEERLLRFHELSEEAFTQAEKLQAEARDHYLAIGTAWYTLAKETELAIRELRARP